MRRPLRKTALGSFLFAAAVLAVAVTIEAQQPKKVSRIGFLSSANPADESVRFEAIRLSLRELGLLTLFNRPVKKETQAHAQ
jgi:hypothetical protein